MRRFIVLSFAFLGWGFYELSGGADFTPETPERVARIEAEQAARDEALRQADLVEKAQQTATTSQSQPIPVMEEGLQLVSLETTVDSGDTQPALASALASTGTSGEATSLFSVPTPTPMAERASLRVETADESTAAQSPEQQDNVASRDLRKVRVSRANMRNGPGTRYNVTAKLAQNTEVVVLRDPGAGWVKLKVLDGGRIGWIHHRLLTKVAP